MPDILITEFMDAAAVDALRAQGDVLYDPTLADRQADIPALIGECRAVIVRNRTQITGDLLDAAPRLTCVGRLGVGLDNIDVTACAARDIDVYPATGANDDAVAEYVVATAMLLLRGAYGASDHVAAGAWPRQALIGREIGGKTIGLIGFGAIARKTARLMRALGTEVIAYDPYTPAESAVWSEATRVDLPDLLAQSDVISLHVPLTPETRGLINAAALNQMKSDAILINAARGGVVDEPAAAAALTEGRLGGAALDVFDAEPLDAAAGAPFQGLNVVLTPHIAGVTVESNVRVSRLIAEKVAARLFGP